VLLKQSPYKLIRLVQNTDDQILRCTFVLKQKYQKFKAFEKMAGNSFHSAKQNKAGHYLVRLVIFRSRLCFVFNASLQLFPGAIFSKADPFHPTLAARVIKRIIIY